MNEIEKLYENAGIKPTRNWQSCLNCQLKTETHYDDWGEEYLTCKRLERPEKCFDAKEYYPPFTREKQLELIKWLARSKNGIGIDLFGLGNPQGKTVWNIGVEFQWEDYNHTFEHKDFDQALAGLINTLWQDLTEEEKQQIKEILE